MNVFLQVKAKFRAFGIDFGKVDKQLNLSYELKKVGIDIGPLLAVVGVVKEQKILDERGVQIWIIVQNA